MTDGVHRQIEVTLRTATFHDSSLLLGWRNDPLAVRFSLTQRMVDPAEHERWFATGIANPATTIWIAEERGEAIGQMRIDAHDGIGTVSIGVAPGHRGRGLGTAMLAALVAEIGENPQIEHLRAVIRPENVASLIAFERNGFRRMGESDQGFVVLGQPIRT